MALKIVDSVIDLIGNTPMARHQKVTPRNGAEVFVKLEYFNHSARA